MKRRISWSLLAFVGVGLLAATLRLWQLDTLPPGFHLDESYQGLEAWRILTEPGHHPFFLRGNFGPLPANAYLNVLTFWLAERLGGAAGPVAMRTTSALVGVLTVLSLHGLAVEMRLLPSSREIKADAVASAAVLSPLFPLFAAITLAVMRWHVHFSRMAIEPIYVPLVWTLSMWWLLRGWRTDDGRTGSGGGWRMGSWLAYAGSGLVLGAGMYTYRGAWIIPLLMALVVLHLLIVATRTEGFFRSKAVQRLRGPLLAALLATLVVAPLAWFFVNNPDLFTTRLQQVNILGETASPADSTLLSNVGKTARMFGPALNFPGDALSDSWGQPGDVDPRRNLPGAPALSWPLAILFYLGLARSLWQLRPAKFSVTFSLPLIGLLGLLLPGVASEYAPHFHRVLGAAAPTALLCALGMDWLWRISSDDRRETTDDGKGSDDQWETTDDGKGMDDGESSRGLRRADAQTASHGTEHRLSVVGRPFASRLLAVALLLGGGLVETRNYFGRWAELPALYHAFDEGLWQIGHALAEQPPGTPIYLTPREMAHPTLAFAWQTQRGESISAPDAPVSFDGRHIFPLSAQPPDRPELYVVIEHEDFRTSLLMPGGLPDAYVEREFVDDAGDLYARFYVRPAGSEFMWPPQQAMNEALGDGIALAGYDVQPETLHPDEILYLQLRWLVDAAPSADWTVFTHLRTLAREEGGERVAGQDGQPGAGSLPTTRWRAGWRILDEYQIALPSDLSPGTYELWAGLYQPSGEQLPAGGGVRLGRVEIGGE